MISSIFLNNTTKFRLVLLLLLIFYGLRFDLFGFCFNEVCWDVYFVIFNLVMIDRHKVTIQRRSGHTARLSITDRPDADLIQLRFFRQFWPLGLLCFVANANSQGCWNCLCLKGLARSLNIYFGIKILYHFLKRIPKNCKWQCKSLEILRKSLISLRRKVFKWFTHRSKRQQNFLEQSSVSVSKESRKI